jgi:hypothetical protein
MRAHPTPIVSTGTVSVRYFLPVEIPQRRTKMNIHPLEALAYQAQKELFTSVERELGHVVASGQGPPIFAYDPDPDGSHLSEVTLAVNVGENAGVRHIVQLGSFWLVPELLERLKEIRHLPLFGRVAPLLYAIREFSTDWNEAEGHA